MTASSLHFSRSCATRLWDSLPPDTEQITIRDVRLFGDADKALAAYCSRVIASVADDHDLRVHRLRTWLLDTFVTELGTQGTAYEGLVATAGMPNTVARALEDRHLLSAELAIRLAMVRTAFCPAHRAVAACG